MQEARRCGVCSEGQQDSPAAKYRCPRCGTKYCSVPCCKKHKEQCMPKAEPVPRSTWTENLTGVQREVSLSTEASSWSVGDILTEDEEEDKVPFQNLQLLKDSVELQDLLLNPHLRQLLLTVDQAADKSSLMRKCMQEPLFVEFADCCLRIVEPPEKENELPE